MPAAQLAVRSGQSHARPATKPSRGFPKKSTSSSSQETKRTNSLGWASSDCHNCEARKLTCDRRRPYCDACTTRGRRCGGYKQTLNWQLGIASRGRMVNVRYPPAEIRPPLQPDGNVKFIFVTENGVGESAPCTANPKKPKKERNPERPSDAAAEPSTSRDADKSNDGIDTPTEVSVEPASNGLEEVSDAVVRRESSPGSLRPPIPLYNLPPEVGEVLGFYEWHFSRTTVTWDVKVNPWKSSLPMVFSTVCLMHAVTALSRRHNAHLMKRSEGVEVLTIKDRALATFNSGLRSTPCEALIATTLSLIGLEYAETGFSNWRIHLQGAYWILETANGLHLAESNPTLRCHIAMLLWWDVTAALLSRQGPVFPQHYLEKILSWADEYPAEWTYMSLNGCPDRLMVAMYNLASHAPFADQLAAEDVCKLESCVLGVLADGWSARPAESVPVKVEAVDDPAVLSRPHSYSMTPYLYPSVSVEKSRVSRASTPTPGDWSGKLIQCWKLSMHLYLLQVFYRQDHFNECVGANDSRNRADERWNLAKSIISLILEMPIDSNMQKQCLLPVVLAGFELRQRTWVTDDDAETLLMRDSVQEYCARWKILTGLWVFGTAGVLLHRLWERMDVEDGSSRSNTPFGIANPVWWGDIVAEDTRSTEEAGTPSGYLFG